MTADRIPHGQITSLVTARPCYPAQAALFAALTGHTGRAARDLDRASTACAIHWQTARSLLTEAELQALATPAPAAW